MLEVMWDLRVEMGLSLQIVEFRTNLLVSLVSIKTCVAF